jgi:hypothetical protein
MVPDREPILKTPCDSFRFRSVWLRRDTTALPGDVLRFLILPPQTPGSLIALRIS